MYLVFESFPGIELALESLDSRRGRVHPELVSVQKVPTPDGEIERATVFVPDGKLGHFLRRLNEYGATASLERPKHRNLVDRINRIGVASVEALWTDPIEDFPTEGQEVWWEVWLRRRDGDEATRLREYCNSRGLTVGRHVLSFNDRTVALVRATSSDLAAATEVLDDLAELRKPHEPAQGLSLEPPTDQVAWVEQLAARTQSASEDAQAVCILDTGVHREHPLLTESLAMTDQHSCDPTWGTDDHDGHGTEMAGLALYGDLGVSITGAGPVVLRYRLESVKVLPPPPHHNAPELYGAVTATAASLAEIARPDRSRAFSMAITAADQANGDADSNRGQPTSWSAALDALAAGRSIDTTPGGLVFLDEDGEAHRRLFLVSAGNVHPSTFSDDHLDRSDLEPVQDPGQAWNVLTIGAYTIWTAWTEHILRSRIGRL
jgi:hypothetical protein